MSLEQELQIKKQRHDVIAKAATEQQKKERQERLRIRRAIEDRKIFKELGLVGDL